MKSHDVVILGATGFTGGLAAQYMARAYTAPNSAVPVRWGIAGRNREKLDKILSGLPCSNKDNIDTFVCDVTNAEDLERVIKATRVVANFAGTPFIDKALPIVELCARHATHYVDITGEIPLHRSSYDLHHAACQASKAVILHGCGYDSVPSDLAAYLAAKTLRERYGAECAHLTTIVGDSSGGMSGGTLATIIELVTKGSSIPGAKEAAARGAYALDPAGCNGGPDRGVAGDLGIVGYEKRAKTWFAPFLMAAVNAPVVRKSNALAGYAYGKEVRVSEVMKANSLLGAVATVVSLATVGVALALPPIRALLFTLGVLPKPGEGPSEKTREEGFFHIYAVAAAAGGKDAPTCTAHVRSGTAGDPGYKATAIMSMESALCLALERDKCREEGGVLTPAYALGDVLVARLNKAGMKVYVDDK
mmetsp:Transcript_14537/g.42692  ORF Transcript_14537/g.42692 Transcript_14537/m.42692 type:complete len:420 (-) Transcript_14537:496-1755(-)